MKKRWILLIVLAAVIILFFIFKKPADSAFDYTETVQAVRETVAKFEGNLKPQDQRRFLAELRKIIEINSNGNGKSDELVIIPVQVVPVRRMDVRRKLSYFGDIRAEESAMIFAKIPDRIVAFPVENGDYVKKGDIIARVDDAKIAAAFRQAEAALASAESQLANLNIEFQRMKKLYEAEALSQSQFDGIKTQKLVAENGVRQAKAAFAAAESQLDDTIISAPISGYVSGKMLGVGDMAAGAMPVVTISQLNMLKIVVDMIETELSQVKVGQKVDIYAEAYPDRRFEGEILRISPVISPATRTASVEIGLDNVKNLLKPGMFCTADIIVETRKDVLTVDKNYVETKTTRINNGSSIREAEIREKFAVYVVRDSLSIYTPIEIGIRSGMTYEVVEGLREGDPVVTVGRTNLRDSSLVTIINR